jgi:hypothetical protein
MRAYMANDKSDALAVSPSVGFEVSLSSSLMAGRGDVNCLAKIRTPNELGDHGQGGKKDVIIQHKDGVSWNELQKGTSGSIPRRRTWRP